MSEKLRQLTNDDPVKCGCSEFPECTHALYWYQGFKDGKAEAAELEATLRGLRESGWMVAVHNDYRQDGKLKTFWLFVKDGRAIKGEGDSDAEALESALNGVAGKDGGSNG